MNLHDWVRLLPLPAEAILEDDPDCDALRCDGCGQAVEEAYRSAATGRVVRHCPACVAERLPRVVEEARGYAERHCRVTRRPLPAYDPVLEYRCTPEGYAAGDRSSYTRSSFRCRLRHEYTNYDVLIRDLDRLDWADGVRYLAVRRRMAELLGYDDDEPPEWDGQYDTLPEREEVGGAEGR